MDISVIEITSTVTDNGTNVVTAMGETVGESKVKASALFGSYNNFIVVVERSLRTSSIEESITKARNIFKWLEEQCDYFRSNWNNTK